MSISPIKSIYNTQASGISSNTGLSAWGQFDLFMVIGDSLAVGIGDVPGPSTVGSKAYFLDQDSEKLIVLADPGLGNANDPGDMKSQDGSIWPAMANAYYDATGRTTIWTQQARTGRCLLEDADVDDKGYYDPVEGAGAPQYEYIVTKYQQAVNKLASYGTINKKYVIVMLGTNDLINLNGAQSAEFLAQYKALASSLVSDLGVDKVLCLQLGRHNLGTKDSDFKVWRNLIRQASEESNNIELLYQGAVTFPSLGYMVDGLHWNQEGNNIAGEVCGVLAARQSAGQVVNPYYVKDTFSQNMSPMLAYRTDQYYVAGSVGSWLVEDTGDNISIASNKLTFDGAGAFATCNMSTDVAYGKGNGVVAKYAINHVSGRAIFGFSSAVGSFPDSISFEHNGGLLITNNGATQNPTGVEIASLYTNSIDYEMAIVQRSDGAFFFIKGGGYTTWTLVNILDGLTLAARLYFIFSSNGINATIDNFEMQKIAGDFASDYGVADFDVSSFSGSPTTQQNTISADQFIVLKFTADGSPGSGDKVELRYRVQDANNYFVAAYSWNTGTSQWDYAVNEVLAGVVTAKYTTTNVGTVNEIRVAIFGDTHITMTGNAGTLTRRGTSFTDSSLNTAKGVIATYTAGNTLTRLTGYSMQSSKFQVLDDV